MAVVAADSKCNLITGYTEGEDNQVSYGSTKWLAQTFTLNELNVIFRCRVKSWTRHAGFFYHYGLRNTDGAGKPVGIDIDHTTLSPTGEARYSPGKWRRFDFGSFPNLAAGTYALIMSVPDSPDGSRHKLRCDATAGAYPLGKAYESDDGGATWNEIPGTDFIFEVWGWEPPPVSDPIPVISNWAPLDYYHSSLLEGFTIVVTTDIPCHLFMRWSDKQPLKHPQAEYRRGILIPIGTRYCFVAWHENEQIEPGDTLTHTFEKPNWPVCQTRWFYFIGSKVTEEQPSASPIFKLHREAEYEPSVFGPVTGTSSNRTIRGNAALWINCHDAADGFIGPWHGAPNYRIVAGARLTASYWIERGFLFFDTSGIPPGSLILEAVLSLHIQGAEKTSSAIYPHIYITQGVQDDPVVTANYGHQLPHTTIGGQVHLDDLVPGQYNHINFNEDGLPFINIGGVTKLCIRQEMDVVDSSPPLGNNQAYWCSTQKGGGYEPLLTVYYVPPKSAATIENRVSYLDDIAVVKWDSAAWSLETGHADCYAGYMDATSSKRGSPMRFRNIHVPKGATIASAKLTFRCWAGNDQDVVKSYLHAEKSPNPAPFSTYADYIARPRTTTFVDWSGIEHWKDFELYTTPFISALIQEVIDQPDWYPGNSIALFWQDHDGRSTPNLNTVRRGHAFTAEPAGHAPLLTISYYE